LLASLLALKITHPPLLIYFLWFRFLVLFLSSKYHFMLV